MHRFPWRGRNEATLGELLQRWRIFKKQIHRLLISHSHTTRPAAPGAPGVAGAAGAGSTAASADGKTQPGASGAVPPGANPAAVGGVPGPAAAPGPAESDPFDQCEKDFEQMVRLGLR